MCPICGEKYYEYSEKRLNQHQLNRYADNSLFAECVRITRGPDDSKRFEAERFGHTAEQTFAYRD